MSGAIRLNVSAVEASAALQVDSTTQGALVPRMTTTQRDAISSPATGLLIYNTTTGRFEFYSGSAWVGLESTGGATGEIFTAAVAIWPATTSGCAAPAKTEYATNGVDLFTADFDQTSIEYGQFNVWMPGTWDAGTLTFEVVWTAAGGSASETVEWNLQARAYADDDAIDQAWGTAIEISDTLIAADDVHYAPESTALTVAGSPAAGELVQFRVWRDAANDTLAADAKLIGIKIHYSKS